MKKPAFLPAVSILALAGGVMPAFAQVYLVPDICYDNTPATCRNVKVTVQGNQTIVDPATITITGRTWPVTVVWYLATPGYTLVTPVPVEFPPEAWITKYQFDTTDPRFCYWWRPGTVYVCHDRNYAPVDFSYAVKAKPASGANPSPASGRIVNN